MQSVEANGARLPVLGLGTWQLGDAARVVEQALRLGYRHIDTAAIYGNEREVGEGVRASGVKRDEIFITTKVWQSDLAPRDFERSTKESLARLRLSEIDLLLIHWPNRNVPLAETVAALCKMKREGFTRHIGVSNFPVALLEEAIALSSEPLVTDQVEWHPLIDQEKLRAACARHGLVVTAYSPIARGETAKNRALAAIGMHYRKTATQVALRYLVQKGAVVIPRTSRRERLEENMSIFDFALNEAEMDEIDALAGKRRLVDPIDGPDWD
jgi:diketogulonate reductase-like aldo/keto reductase